MGIYIKRQGIIKQYYVITMATFTTSLGVINNNKKDSGERITKERMIVISETKEMHAS